MRENASPKVSPKFQFVASIQLGDDGIPRRRCSAGIFSDQGVTHEMPASRWPRFRRRYENHRSCSFRKLPKMGQKRRSCDHERYTRYASEEFSLRTNLLGHHEERDHRDP